MPRTLTTLLVATALAATTACGATDAAGPREAGHAHAGGAQEAGGPQGAGGAAGAPAPKSAADSGVGGQPVGPALPTVLLEATLPSTPITVQVLEARRATADTVRISIAFISKAPAPAPSAPTPPTALFPAGTDPADFCLTTADGSRRLFLLRDAQNQPVLEGSLSPLAAGERRVVQFSFPAPPAQATGRVTVHLGPLTLPNLAISN